VPQYSPLPRLPVVHRDYRTYRAYRRGTAPQGGPAESQRGTTPHHSVAARHRGPLVSITACRAAAVPGTAPPLHHARSTAWVGRGRGGKCGCRRKGQERGRLNCVQAKGQRHALGCRFAGGGNLFFLGVSVRGPRPLQLCRARIAVHFGGVDASGARF
jgi:hypothetical protein